MRLDIFLVEHKFYETRNKAQNAIKNNFVLVNGKTIDKANFLVNDNDVISKTKQEEYVSRGAYKLLEAINHWKIDFKNKIVLDIGASTGGFTDAAIRNGAKLVYAVDVGTNQLHHSLRNHRKIKSIENMHLKDLTNKLISEKIDIVVADISFISLTKLIDKLVVLFFYRYKCIFLIKPEFELQPNEISNGKVKSQKLLNKAINKIENYAVNHNFKIIGLISSPILGNKAGNLEYLIYLEKQ